MESLDVPRKGNTVRKAGERKVYNVFRCIYANICIAKQALGALMYECTVYI